MTRLSRECQLVWACRPVRYCFVVHVYKFPPSPNAAGMADGAACLCCRIGYGGSGAEQLWVSLLVLMAACGGGSILTWFAGGHLP